MSNIFHQYHRELRLNRCCYTSFIPVIQAIFDYYTIPLNTYLLIYISRWESITLAPKWTCFFSILIQSFRSRQHCTSYMKCLVKFWNLQMYCQRQLRELLFCYRELHYVLCVWICPLNPKLNYSAKNLNINFKTDAHNSDTCISRKKETFRVNATC